LFIIIFPSFLPIKGWRSYVMEALLVSTGVIALAEVDDETQVARLHISEQV